MTYSKAFEPGRAPSSKRLIDSECGIIRWISEIPIDPGEPAIFNYSVKMCDSGKHFPVACCNNNGGAGLTRDVATQAAVGEAVERYCSSIFFPDELTLGCCAELQERGRALKPCETALFHPRQKDQIRYTWFEENTDLSWTEGYSLTRKEPIFVPACLVYVPYFPFRRSQGEQSIASSISTGQACSQTAHGALLSGLYEIVERDAFMISWLNQLPLPRVDIDSNATLGTLFRERFARDNLRYHVYRMATDISIPAVACMLIDDSFDPPMICFGGASNLDPARAALKAILEAAQTREWAKYLGKQGEAVVIESDFRNIDDFEKHVFLYGYGDMMPAVEFLLQSDKTIGLAELGSGSTGDATNDLRLAMKAVEDKGLEVMAVDLTADDVRECGYYVMKVLVPGMQVMEGDHTHRCLGGSRLYEVPGKLGYDLRPSFDTLNGDPHPYP
jgi:ribosomal protein S12 methylthiotransferase accessory factor